MIDLFDLARPVVHRLDPETAHSLTLRALEWGAIPGRPVSDDRILRTRLFGRDLPNPLGLAAGFDKNARVFARMYGQGFGFVEIGGVTPIAQQGNPRPRLFRLSEDRAVINRMGFNNDGMDVIAERVRRHRRPDRILGINLASNSDSADPGGDFVTLVERFAPLADFLTLDISCPNTANGKQFLQPGPLTGLLARIAGLFVTRPDLPRPALVAKIAPDLSHDDLSAIIECLIAGGVDGLTVSNTTAERPADLINPARGERGGLSGRPLFRRSTDLLKEVARLSAGRLTLIGVGGISCGGDAYEKILAGASVLQLYTALVYQGPAVINEILRELSRRLTADGFASISEAVGAGL